LPFTNLTFQRPINILSQKALGSCTQKKKNASGKAGCVCVPLLGLKNFDYEIFKLSEFIELGPIESQFAED